VTPASELPLSPASLLALARRGASRRVDRGRRDRQCDDRGPEVNRTSDVWHPRIPQRPPHERQAVAPRERRTSTRDRVVLRPRWMCLRRLRPSRLAWSHHAGDVATKLSAGRRFEAAAATRACLLPGGKEQSGAPRPEPPDVSAEVARDGVDGRRPRRRGPDGRSRRADAAHARTRARLRECEAQSLR
jgi:hypothetical protein